MSKQLGSATSCFNALVIESRYRKVHMLARAIHVSSEGVQMLLIGKNH